MGSKIESELTPEEVVELLEALAKTKGGEKLRVIREAAKERGIEVSLMGASSFRDGALHPYLEKLKMAKQTSQMIAEVAEAGDETGLLVGGRTKLAEEVLDFLMTNKPDVKEFSGLAKTLSMLSGSNQGDRMAAAKLKEMEAKEEERQAEKKKLEEKFNKAKEKGSLSQEAIELIEEQIQLLG